jgi:hypothetical protein
MRGVSPTVSRIESLISAAVVDELIRLTIGNPAWGASGVLTQSTHRSARV